jgi:hypothetical protein
MFEVSQTDVKINYPENDDLDQDAVYKKLD